MTPRIINLKKLFLIQIVEVCLVFICLVFIVLEINPLSFLPVAVQTGIFWILLVQYFLVSTIVFFGVLSDAHETKHHGWLLLIVLLGLPAIFYLKMRIDDLKQS